MNYCAIQQNGVVRSREVVVCPKPRRVGLFNGAINDPPSPLRRHLSHQGVLSDSQAGYELLDIILSKGGHGYERPDTNNSTQVGMSSPFFCGSPPSRVSNPLIQDARFGLPSSPPMSPTSNQARKGGCVRANFGNNPAVRVEGFDCLDRDHSRNCRIPALA